jgi:transcriptional regulator GlxA family with amidase domain
MTLDRRTLLSAALITGAAGGASGQVNAAVEPLRRPASGNIRVAFLIDRFHNIMDLAGPWEAFAAAGVEAQHFELFTVSPHEEELRLGGIKVRPDYTFANAPQPHVVVMGAQTGSTFVEETTQAKVAWLQRVAAQADLIFSVCTGAFLLARTGLIDGLLSTTHHDFYEDFARQFPSVTLVRDRRFVDNGKFVSGGGLTSGVDAALHVIARYWGADEAETVAAYMEHSSDGWRTGVRAPA